MAKGNKIDRIRNSAVEFDLKEAGDTSGIENVFSLDNKIYIQTKHGVYNLKLADEIDPNRTNILVQNSIQKVIHFDDKYSETEWIFRTAHALFQQDDGMSETINKDAVFKLCISMAMDFSYIQNAVKRIIADEKLEEVNFFENLSKTKSLLTPHSNDHEGALTTFLYKASHIHRDLFEIIKLAYPEMQNRKGMYSGFQKLLQEKYGKDDLFVRFVGDSLHQLNTIKNARNCYEHPKNGHQLHIRNYHQTKPNELMIPSFRIEHKDTPHGFVGISLFIETMLGNIASIVEGILVLICIKNPRSFGGFQYCIIENRDLMNQHRLSRYQWSLLPRA